MGRRIHRRMGCTCPTPATPTPRPTRSPPTPSPPTSRDVYTDKVRAHINTTATPLFFKNEAWLRKEKLAFDALFPKCRHVGLGRAAIRRFLVFL